MRVAVLALAAVSLAACAIGAGVDEDTVAVPVPEPVPAIEERIVRPPAPLDAPVRLEPDPDDPGRSVLDVDLSEHHGCGWGVHAGTPAQHVALHARYVGDDPGALPDEVTLPDPSWQVEIQLGRDLFANWCDDVLEPGEPERLIGQEWPAAAGTLVVREHPRGDCPGTAVLDIRGLVVERPDGRLVRVPDLTVTNGSWGCIAG